MLRLVERLPAHSHYKAERARDESGAEALIAAGIKPRTRKYPDFEEWTHEVAALARVEDLLGQLIQAVAGGGKSRPAPRPQSGYDLVRDRNADAYTNSVVAILTPDT